MFEQQAILQFFEVFNSRDLEAMGHMFNPDAEFYFPKTQPLIGKDRILKFLKLLFRQYPELSFRVVRVICQENLAAVHWTNSGMNRRKEPYENEGATIIEFKDGKIAYISDFFKDTGRW